MTTFVKGITRPHGTDVEVEIKDSEDGGSGAGASDIKRIDFKFAFDTPQLELGVPVYEPVVGEWLDDAIFYVQTLFADDRNVFADLSVDPTAYGMYGNLYGSYLLNNWAPFPGIGIESDSGHSQSSLRALSGNGPTGMVPARFISANPLKLYVGKPLSGRAMACDGSGVPIASTVGE